MLNYHVREAGSSLRLLGYCEKVGIQIPNRYEMLRQLRADDYVSGNAVLSLFKEAETLAGDPLFFESFEDKVLRPVYELDGPADVPAATLLAVQAKKYATAESTSPFQLRETPTHLVFSIPRFAKNPYRKYGDLMIHAWLKNSIALRAKRRGTETSIALPYERSYYGSHADYFESVGFEAERFEMRVQKEDGEILPSLAICNQIGGLERILAAGNMLRSEEITPESLAFMLGYSPKMLRAELKHIGTDTASALNMIRFVRIRRALIASDWDTKGVAYEFGFKSNSAISKIFTRAVGMGLREYRAQMEC